MFAFWSTEFLHAPLLLVRPGKPKATVTVEDGLPGCFVNHVAPLPVPRPPFDYVHLLLNFDFCTEIIGHPHESKRASRHNFNYM